MRIALENLIIEFDSNISLDEPIRFYAEGEFLKDQQIQVSVYKVGSTECSLVFTALTIISDQFIIEWPEIPGDPTSGAGLISLRLVHGEMPLNFVPPSESYPVLLGSNGLLDKDIADKVREALEAQEEISNLAIVAPGYIGDDSFTVNIALYGCYLDCDHRIDGGWLRTTSLFLNPIATVDTLNHVFGIELKPKTYQPIHNDQARSISILTFNNVKAPDRQTAIQIVNSRLSLICSIMAMDRGAAPTVFGIVTRSHTDNKLEAHLVKSHYSGNLFAGFGPGSIKARLDILLRGSIVDPWLSYIIPLYSQAIAETQAPFRVSRLWSILEATAKRRPRVLNANSKPEKSFNVHGQIIRGKDLANVIDYILSETFSIFGTPWDPVSVATEIKHYYAIRNIVAHEGTIQLEKLSERQRESVVAVFEHGGLQSLQMLAEKVLLTEAHRALVAAESH